MNKRIKEYDILRVILVLLVIVGHSSYIEIQTKYGGIYYASMFFEHGYYLSRAFLLFEKIVSFIYLFHMELFMLLSGTLFIYSYRKYSGKEFFIKKIKRLMIPFCVVLIFSVLVKYFTGYWNNSNSIIKDIIFGQILLNGNTHLWYLPTLLVITTITYFLEKIKINKYIRIILFIILYFASFYINIVFISLVLKYLLWFNLGILFEENRETINKNNSISYAILEFIIAILFFLIYLKCPSNHQLVVYPVITCFMIASVYTIAYYISTTRFNIPLLSDNALEIYLVSDLINYIFLFLLFKLFPISLFSNSRYSILIIIVRFLLQLLLSLLIIMIYKKIKNWFGKKVL